MPLPPYTLADLRTAIQDHGFSDTTTTRLDEVINDTYMDVCAREPWPFLEKETTQATVSGTAQLTLPSDFNSLRSLACDALSLPMQPLREDDFRKRFAGQYTYQSLPQYYYFTGQASTGASGAVPGLFLWPVPDAAYTMTISYLMSVTGLNLTTDVPVIPANHQRVLILGAIAQLYLLEDELMMSQAAERQYEKRLVNMRGDLWQLQVDRPERVYDLYGSDDYYIF